MCVWVLEKDISLVFRLDHYRGSGLYHYANDGIFMIAVEFYRDWFHNTFCVNNYNVLFQTEFMLYQIGQV